MRLALVLLCLAACGPVPVAARACSPTSLHCDSRYADAAVRGLVLAAGVVPVFGADAIQLAPIPTDPDAITQGDLLAGIGDALKAGNYLLVVMFLAVGLLWALRSGLLKISTAEYTWMHTGLGAAVSTAVLGFLLSVTVALQAGKFTWASAGVAFAAALASALAAALADKAPTAAVAAAKAGA